MYLTRFRINTARADARRLLASPHRVHGAVNASFPEEPSRDGGGPRVLWRVDREANHRATLFVVSPGRPDLTHLVEQAGWPHADGPHWQSYGYADFLDGLKTDDRWAFRLTANPVHAARCKDGEPTKRTAHRTPAHQMGWLLKRQEALGFAVVEKPLERRMLKSGDELELLVRDHSPQSFGRGAGTDEKNSVRFTRVTFEGRLRVTDPAALRKALTQGIGKEKAYGCGLLTLAPVVGAE
ncbi:type I-E CRISPR-associated protein Cas6/Cse3/CasE [Streptomyces spiramenti]|uniref:Type I-E CRISPR-associated protein Cas6/Cse3/CasE n=1 Tax=Streptomyces spiramenti TaxID=2720606 RepID=A0ABX1AIZ1_9ACTN|nr:type I-E CRISPR-associated protein Cas6/Cse3/CasE [Streptomyces spiramenti]NJP67117.1 type I-E CRISPR-associated protein Cas6/Cse3/CasE [Streptomyces spiramenti]